MLVSAVHKQLVIVVKGYAAEFADRMACESCLICVGVRCREGITIFDVDEQIVLREE